MSFNLVSSLLPLASGTAPQTYRWALALGLLVPVVAGALGYLAFAFVAAALVVPVVYTIYMYDVNQWDDQPLGVTLGAVGLAGALGVGFTWLWHGLLDSGAAASGRASGWTGSTGPACSCCACSCRWSPRSLKQVGPVLLAQDAGLRRPHRRTHLRGGRRCGVRRRRDHRRQPRALQLARSPRQGQQRVLGLARALGRPRQADRLRRRDRHRRGGLLRASVAATPASSRPTLRGLAEAIGANIAFQLAMFLAGRVGGTGGAVLGLVLGLAVAVVLLLRLRHLLHVGVLEAALESASDGDGLKDTAHGTAWCPSCDLPLLDGANFCVACGTAVRAAQQGLPTTQRRAPTTTPRARPAPSRRTTTSSTALVVGAALAVILAAGLVGQVAAAAPRRTSRRRRRRTSTSSPDLKGGPQIDPEPTPAPAPGPSGRRRPPRRRRPGSPGTFVLAADSDTAQGVRARACRPGWEVVDSNESQVVAAKGNAVFTVDITSAPGRRRRDDPGPPATGSCRAGVQDLQVTQPKQIPLPNANFVAGAAAQPARRSSPPSREAPSRSRASPSTSSGGTGSASRPRASTSPGELDRTPSLIDEYVAMLNSVTAVILTALPSPGPRRARLSRMADPIGIDFGGSGIKAAPGRPDHRRVLGRPRAHRHPRGVDARRPSPR